MRAAVPYWDLAGLKFSRDNSPTPIMADESVHSPHDAFAVTRENAVDCINIKLMKSGAYCGAYKSPPWPPAPGSPAWLAAWRRRACLDGRRSPGVFAEEYRLCGPGWFLELSVDPVIGGMQMKDGIVTLPNTPGLDWTSILHSSTSFTVFDEQ